MGTGCIVPRLLKMAVISPKHSVNSNAGDDAAHFRDTFELAAVGIAHVALDGHWLLVNQALCDIVGYSHDELRLLTFQDITFPDDLDRDLHYVQQLLRGEIDNYSMEKRYIRRDGSTIWINLTVSLVRDALGQPQFFISIIKDIQQRKEAEERLAHSEARFRCLTQATVEVVWTVDARGYVIGDTSSWKAFTGIATAQVTARDWWRAVYADDRGLWQAEWLRARAAKAPFSVRCRMRRHDGEWRLMTVRGVPLFDADQNICEWVGVCTDDTEHERALNEMMTLHWSWQHLIGVLQQLVNARSEVALMQSVTAAMRQLCSAQGASFVLRDGDQCHYVHTDAIEPLWAGQKFPLKMCISGWTMLHADVAIVPDIYSDARIPIEAYEKTFVKSLVMVPIRAHDPIGSIGVYWDRCYEPSARDILMLRTLADASAIALENIRAYDELERRVAERTFQLHSASQAKTQFISSMSHELRTPLNAILGFAQLLEMQSSHELTGTQRSSVEQIQKAGWHLLEVINDLLDLGKIEAGALQLSMTVVDVFAEIDECLQLIAHRAAQNNLNLVWKKTETIDRFMRADRTRLRQVLLNLLSNAVKYNRQHGRVEVVCTACDGRIRIAIRDSGIGMSKLQQEHLFEAFNRLGRDADNTEGTGIGLVITKRLVEAMGGTINCSSKAGIGSDFWIEFDQCEPPREARAIPLAIENALMPPPRQCSILYVEDNPVNMLLTGKIIESQPALRMLSANSGAEGFALAMQRPDLILLDISLPDMSGVDLVRKLRSHPTTEHLPIVALSANASEQAITEALSAGFDRYLTKPLRLHTFLATLYDLLQRENALPAV